MLPYLLVFSPMAVSLVAVLLPWMWRYRQVLLSPSWLRHHEHGLWAALFAGSLYIVVFCLLGLAAFKSPQRAQWNAVMATVLFSAVLYFAFLGTAGVDRMRAAQSTSESTSNSYQTVAALDGLRIGWTHRALPFVWALGQSLLAASKGLFGFAAEQLIAIGLILVLLFLPSVVPLRKRWELLLFAIAVIALCIAGIYVGLKDCVGSYCSLM